MNSFGAEGTTRSIFTGLVASLRHLMKWGDNDPSTSDILNVLLPSLLVELRQRSVRGSLSGSNPFERFRTFETSCSTEEYAFELASVRPELIERIHATSERRHRFESWVNECAKEDHYALVQCGMINDYAVPEFDLQSVSGDSLCYLLSSIHDLGSFSLCHGVSGSIQVLLYAFEHHLLDGQQVRTLNENINDFIRFGLTVDWRCGTSNYYCYSLMTGLAGVLALLKQIKSENICLEPLIPLCQVKD